MDDEDQRLLARVAAVRTGPVRTHLWGGRETVSAAVKTPVPGPVRLSRLGLAGDEQADLRVHGGPEKAVLFYALSNYPRWRAEEGLDLPEGALFENLTLAGPSPDVSGPDETTVLLGEVWRVGTATVQISQPRSPCYKLARRWDIKDLPVRVQNRGWTGWYARVLDEGEIAAGDEVILLDRPVGAPTMAEITRVVNVDKHDLAGAARLVDVPGLPERWRSKLQARIDGATEDDRARLRGPTE